MAHLRPRALTLARNAPFVGTLHHRTCARMAVVVVTVIASGVASASEDRVDRTCEVGAEVVARALMSHTLVKVQVPLG